MKHQLTAPLLPQGLTSAQSIAFILSPRLGDSLLSMVVVNNLVRNGYKVDVFGDFIYGLKEWFSWLKVQPKPAPEQVKKIFSAYDVLLHAYPTDVMADTRNWHPCVCVLDHSPLYRQRFPMPDIQVDICRHELNLVNVVRDNNITIPSDLSHRKFPRRIVIHPTGSQQMREWLPKRFVKLAHRLQAQGWQPEFIVSPDERPHWEWVQQQGIALPKFSSMDAVARWVYESGWFIGTDSGIGHLASNLGIATITLGIRPSLLRRWRPAWTHGVILLPPKWLITRPLKEKFWKYFISVNQVERAFNRLQQRLGD